MENYKEKYEDALERARVWKEKSGMPVDKQGILDDIFPELKKSDDEKIKNEIIDYLKGFIPHHNDDLVAKSKLWIAWLEKQGEKSYKELPQTPHKYNVGDWIVSKYNSIYQIKEVLKGNYNLLCVSNAEEINSISQVDNSSRLLCMKDIQDLLEKQGEQKVAKFMTKSYITPNPEFFQWIYNRLVYQHHENPNMDYMRSLKERIEDMQEIVSVKTGDILVRQNPTWSEEDENMLQQALSTIRYALSIPADKEDDPCFAGSSTIAWLKSLKERVQPKTKHDWSEEDEDYRLDVNVAVNNYCDEGYAEELCGWLKSLKEKMKGE